MGVITDEMIEEREGGGGRGKANLPRNRKISRGTLAWHSYQFSVREREREKEREGEREREICDSNNDPIFVCL